MSMRISGDEFLRNLKDSGLFSPDEVANSFQAGQGLPADGGEVARRLVEAGRLTSFQAERLGERRFEELWIGNYEVLDRLGAGGMGTVYKARHRRMKRVVAIKVLSKAVAQSGQFVQRFQREVEAVARLSHPNIVMAFDADEAEAGHFLVMEFVNGRDLATVVQQNGPLPLRETVECVVQAARALDYAHSQGIIHRDIKPANLLRDVGGLVKVADLGLARFSDPLGQADESSALTQAGTVMGTVDYMPPEQALGLTTLDHRADVYSLGCVLYFLLLGQPPYQGGTLMAILLKHREAPIPSLASARPGVPAGLDECFRKMVAKKPEERYASMAEVVRALEALAPGLSEKASPPPPPQSSVTVVQSVTVDLAPGASALGLTAVPAPATPPSPSGLSALLVEPSRAQAVIVRKYLQEVGCREVHTAPSGAKALEMAGASPPDVFISAMHLPDMTGVQLAQKVRAAGPLSSAGFVLITSQGDEPEAQLPQSAVRLPKPFDRDSLARALSASTGGPRVLLVDDSAAARTHERGVLAGLGVRRIAEAADGEEAVALLGKQPFDLVVTDYNMPRLDGRGLVEYIRQRGPAPNVPILMVTTETDAGKLDAVRRLGVTAICDKSFNPEVVRGVLQRLA